VSSPENAYPNPVQAPVEWLRYARYASGFSCSYRSRTQNRTSTRIVNLAAAALLTGWGSQAQAEALPQPVNNAGGAIQVFNLLYRRFVTGRPPAI
jgi:hypothetical protein